MGSLQGAVPREGLSVGCISYILRERERDGGGRREGMFSLFQNNSIVPPALLFIVPLALLFLNVVGVNTLPTASILIPLLRLRLRYAVSQGTT